MSPLVGTPHVHHHLYKYIPIVAQIPTIVDTPVPNIRILTYHPFLCNLTHSTQFTQYLVVPLKLDHVLRLLPSFHFFPTKGSYQVPYILNIIHVTIISMLSSI